MKESPPLKLKILICEEDRRILKRLESWVKAMGEIAIASDDGVISLEIFKRERPDIILVSQNLKSMGGLEFIENIKQEVPTQAVILMIGDNDSVHVKQAIDLQVDKYLNKPVEASFLFKAIEDLAQEKVFHTEFKSQKRLLQDYKDALDISFSVTKHNHLGQIFYANKLFCETTKLSYEDAIKGTINPLNNPNEDMDEVFSILKRDHIYRARQVFLFKDTQDHIIDITAVAILDDDKNIIEYLVFSNDVSDVVHTARKIKEQELDRKLQKLNHIKELNRVKDSFLTVFTHELRTPLNAIINFSEYVKKHLLKEEFAKRDTLLEQITEINKSGWHMLKMITNLMEAIKLKDSKIILNISECNLDNIVDNILKKYTENSSNINIEKKCKNVFSIESDELRLSQILDNLLSNAVKYAQTKVLVVLDANETEFSMKIIDDGEGFSDKSKVFNLFEQLDEDNMTRESTGTGVGLYIVKQLCDRMSYKIEIRESQELAGACVIIRGKREII